MGNRRTTVRRPLPQGLLGPHFTVKFLLRRGQPGGEPVPALLQEMDAQAFQLVAHADAKQEGNKKHER